MTYADPTRKPEPDAPATVGELLAQGVECRAGDPAIGRDTRLPLVLSLNQKLRELAADTGLGVIARFL